jgi:hypothetical protein
MLTLSEVRPPSLSPKVGLTGKELVDFFRISSWISCSRQASDVCVGKKKAIQSVKSNEAAKSSIDGWGQ